MSEISSLILKFTRLKDIRLGLHQILEKVASEMKSLKWPFCTPQ